MATQKFSAGDMQGLTPAVDPTQSDKIFALEWSGRNFIFDSLGPKSSFGNRQLMPQPRTAPSYVQGVRLKLRSGDRCFHFFGDGIWEWNEFLGGYKLVYLTPDTTKVPGRWSYGYLAGYLFFCHPRVGILVYNIDTGLCVPHRQIGIGTPSNAMAIEVNNGRLCVMDPLFYSWSNPSDGLDFTPKLGGGGFQLISDRVAGTPILLTGYAGGCLLWTTEGVLRSEFTGDAAVFRFRSLGTEYRPSNSFCSCRVDNDTMIILDERGLFQSKGDSITPFAPLFNEFLIKYIREWKLSVDQNLRLEWDRLKRMLYVSVSHTYANAIYDLAFVYYPPLDKWGQFNEPHYGILPVLIDDGERSGDYFGFVDSDGIVKYWSGAPNREAEATTITQSKSNLFMPAIQRDSQYAPTDEGRLMSSTLKISSFSMVGMTQRAGYYEAGILTPKTVALTGLDSKLTFGLFRPTGPGESDDASEILNVLIRSEESNIGESTQIDWQAESGTDDWQSGSGNVDRGLGLLGYVNHKLRVIGTLDGKTEWQSDVPMLELESPAGRYYSCSVVGVWHMIEITAADVGESFHIRTGEITATSAGRIL